jgi:hypothetical protein
MQLNKWSPSPLTKVIASTKLIPKINEELKEDEFEIEILNADTLL